MSKLEIPGPCCPGGNCKPSPFNSLTSRRVFIKTTSAATLGGLLGMRYSSHGAYTMYSGSYCTPATVTMRPGAAAIIKIYKLPGGGVWTPSPDPEDEHQVMDMPGKLDAAINETAWNPIVTGCTGTVTPVGFAHSWIITEQISGAVQSYYQAYHMNGTPEGDPMMSPHWTNPLKIPPVWDPNNLPHINPGWFKVELGVSLEFMDACGNRYWIHLPWVTVSFHTS